MNDLKVTKYKVGEGDQPCLNYLSMAASAFHVIPISDEAKKHVLGYMDFAGHELVLLKGKAMEEVWTFLNDNAIHVQDDLHELDAEQMLWYISGLERRRGWMYHNCKDYPCVVDDKAMTYQQAISWVRLVRRNILDGNYFESKWYQDTLMFVVKYRDNGKETGNGITIGIEPDGYAHS